MPSFEMLSGEGLPIRGDVESPRSPRALVVIVHGFKGFKDWGFFPWLSEHLCNHGFAAVRFNMSRSGIGDDPEEFGRLDLFADDTYSGQIADLIAVTRHVQKPGVPTFLLGHSRGGGVALLAASQLKLKGLITWSAISTADRWDGETKRKWRADGSLDIVNQRTKQVMKMSPRILDDYEGNASKLNILDAVRSLTVPLLVIHGGRDESVPVGEAKTIASKTRDSSLLVIENAGHTMNAIHPLVHVPRELVYAAEVSAHFVDVYAR